jgi:YidC/Oxa1 family membrane protein insertase
MFFFADILQPLEDAADAILVFLHDQVGFGWGMSIVGMTVIVRLAILPLTIKQIKSMNALRELQPQVKVIQEKYKEDKQRMNQEMMKFYRENKVNPLASCLPLLLQLPVFLALFRLLRSDEFKNRLAESAHQGWVFIDNLAEPATGPELIVLLALYIGSQMAATLVMSVTADKTQQRIMLLLPLAFAAIIPNFPAGLIVYWITTNFWTFGQQVVVRKIAPPPQVVPIAGGGNSGDGSRKGAPKGAAKGTADAERRAAPPPPPRKKKKRRR